MARGGPPRGREDGGIAAAGQGHAAGVRRCAPLPAGPVGELRPPQRPRVPEPNTPVGSGSANHAGKKALPTRSLPRRPLGLAIAPAAHLLAVAVATIRAGSGRGAGFAAGRRHGGFRTAAGPLGRLRSQCGQGQQTGKQEQESMRSRHGGRSVIGVASARSDAGRRPKVASDRQAASKSLVARPAGLGSIDRGFASPGRFPASPARACRALQDATGRR